MTKKKPFNVYFDIYTNATVKDVKQILYEWGQKHGLTKKLINECFEIEFRNTHLSEYHFMINFEEDQWIFMDVSESEAHQELLSKLGKIDSKVEMYSEWANLERLMDLKSKAETARKQLEIAEEEMEEENPHEKPTMFKTTGFAEIARITNEATEKAYKEYLKKKNAKTTP